MTWFVCPSTEEGLRGGLPMLEPCSLCGLSMPPLDATDARRASCAAFLFSTRYALPDAWGCASPSSLGFSDWVDPRFRTDLVDCGRPLGSRQPVDCCSATSARSSCLCSIWPLSSSSRLAQSGQCSLRLVRASMASCISSGTADAWGLRHEDGPGAKTVEAGMLGSEVRPLGFQDLTSRRCGSRAMQGVRTRRGGAAKGWRENRTGPDSSGDETGAGPQYAMPIESVV